MVPSTVSRIPWSSDFVVKQESRQIFLLPGRSSNFDYDTAMDHVLVQMREAYLFPSLLKNWRDEKYAVLDAKSPFSIMRAAHAIFGMVISGAHMTVYTQTSEGIRIWIPRRSSTRSEYPSMLDNSVAGGIAAGETPRECVAREAWEETRLPEDLVRRNAVAHEPVRWFHRAKEAGVAETNLLVPCVQHVFDLEVDGNVIPEAVAGEIEEFYLWSPEQVKEALHRGDFKPSCGLVMMDFLIRHGFLTRQNEGDFEEIVARIHRELPFAGC